MNKDELRLHPVCRENTYFALIDESYTGKPAITIHCRKSALTPELESRLCKMAEELLAEFDKKEDK